MAIEGGHWSVPVLAAAALIAAGALAASGLGSSSETPDPVVPDGLRGGDQLAYRETIATPAVEESFATTAEVGPSERLLDQQGRPLPGHAIELARRSGNQTVSAETCRALATHETGALREVTAGPDGLERLARIAWEAAEDHDPWTPTWAQAGPPSWTAASPDLVYEPVPCWDRSPLADQRLTAGVNVSVSRLAPLGVGSIMDEDTETQPARPTTFQGRPALSFAFSASVELPQPSDPTPQTATLAGEAILADGVPAPARLDVTLATEAPQGPEVSWSRTLTSYNEGEGILVRATAAGATADRAANTTTELGREGPPGVPGTLPYPLEDAVEAVTSDPSAGAGPFLRQHPDAYLSEAVYERDFLLGPTDREVPDRAQTATDGGWRLTFSSGERHCIVETVRLDGTDEPGEPAPSRTTVNAHETFLDRNRTTDATAPPIETLPGRVARAEVARGALDVGGLSPADLTRAEYRVQPTPSGTESLVTFRVSNVDEPGGSEESESAREVVVDARTGGLLAAWSPQEPSHVPPEPTTAGVGQAGPEQPGEIPWGLAAAGALAFVLVLPVYRYVLLPLYSRLSSDELLENEARAELYREIHDRPGIHQAALVRAAGIGEGATEHHLRKLVDNDLVERRKIGGYVRYFPVEVNDPDRQRELGVLRSGSNREVYEIVSEQPSLSFRDVARRLDLSVSTVHRAVRQLREAGLVDDDGDQT